MSEFQTRLNSVPSGGFLTDRDKDKKPILDVRELGIDFGGRHSSASTWALSSVALRQSTTLA